MARRKLGMCSRGLRVEDGTSGRARAGFACAKPAPSCNKLDDFGVDLPMLLGLQVAAVTSGGAPLCRFPSMDSDAIDLGIELLTSDLSTECHRPQPMPAEALKPACALGECRGEPLARCSRRGEAHT